MPYRLQPASFSFTFGSVRNEDFRGLKCLYRSFEGTSVSHQPRHNKTLAVCARTMPSRIRHVLAEKAHVSLQSRGARRALGRCRRLPGELLGFFRSIRAVSNVLARTVIGGRVPPQTVGHRKTSP